MYNDFNEEQHIMINNDMLLYITQSHLSIAKPALLLRNIKICVAMLLIVIALNKAPSLVSCVQLL